MRVQDSKKITEKEVKTWIRNNHRKIKIQI